MRQSFQAFEHHVPEHALGQGREHRARQRDQPCAPVQRAHVHLGREVLEKVIGQVLGRFQARAKGILALVSHHAVRVFAFRQEQEPRRAAVAQARQRRLERPPRGLPAGPVAIETVHHLVRGAEQRLGMIAGGRGPQCRHAVAKAELGEGDDVHVPLDDHHLARFPDVALGGVEPKQQPTLVKELALR